MVVIEQYYTDLATHIHELTSPRCYRSMVIVAGPLIFSMKSCSNLRYCVMSSCVVWSLIHSFVCHTAITNNVISTNINQISSK